MAAIVGAIDVPGECFALLGEGDAGAVLLALAVAAEDLGADNDLLLLALTLGLGEAEGVRVALIDAGRLLLLVVATPVIATTLGMEVMWITSSSSFANFAGRFSKRGTSLSSVGISCSFKPSPLMLGKYPDDREPALKLSKFPPSIAWLSSSAAKSRELIISLRTTLSDVSAADVRCSFADK